MLRALVLILIAVNAAFWAWTQGWLNAVVGPALHPDAQHEPERLGKQAHADLARVVRPQWPAASGQQAASAVASAPASSASAPTDGASSPAVASAPAAAALTAASSGASSTNVAGVASASAAASVAAPVAAPVAPSAPVGRVRCVEAGPFQLAEFNAAEAQVKKALPSGGWQVQSVSVPGLWLVYMGPYGDPDMLEKKQAELRRIRGLSFEEVRTPASLAQGLSLGRYNQLAEADNALNQLRNRGIRTARVVNVRQPMQVQLLRVPQADDNAVKLLNSIKLPQDKGFIACWV